MTSRSPILVTRKIPGRGIELLRREFGEVDINPHDRPFTPEELAAEVVGRRGVLCLVSDRIDGHILAAAEDCKIFANYSVDYSNIDVAKATRRGVLVANTPGVLTDATADVAWVLLMSAARRVVEGDTLVRSGRWTGHKPNELLGADIAGQTLGLVGAGRIGSAVAMRSRGWGMNVLYCEEVRNHKLEAECGATRVEFDVLVRQSDFISVHVPLTDKTRGMFGREQFQAMKDSAILINTSSGAVIDEAALVEALRSGEIAGAGLDSYANEPRLAPGLAELDNVVLLPHIGSATIRARGKMSEVAANAIVTALRGSVPQNAVNPGAWESLSK